MIVLFKPNLLAQEKIGMHRLLVLQLALWIKELVLFLFTSLLLLVFNGAIKQMLNKMKREVVLLTQKDFLQVNIAKKNN